jgi:hypothetical protein
VFFPSFLVAPALGFARSWNQNRRKVRLTVHQARPIEAYIGIPSVTASSDDSDIYCVTVTNASKERDVVVTHVWFATQPEVHIPDEELPVRLKYSEPWETYIPVDAVPAPVSEVGWLARCNLAPDDKVVKSRPRERVPLIGRIPRNRPN